MPRVHASGKHTLLGGSAYPGDLVAVQGIGSMGHLGTQFANKFGYNVAAIGRGSYNPALAKKLEASVYIDGKSTNAAQGLQKNGSRSIQGWTAGTRADSEDTLRFAELRGVRPMIEICPLEKAAEA